MSHLKYINGVPVTVEEYAVVPKNADVLVTDNYTISAINSGAEIKIATDGKVISGSVNFPIGAEFTIRNVGANGNNIITFSPESTAAVFGAVKRRKGTNADATAADGLVCVAGGVLDKDWINTKTSAIKNDFTTFKKVSATEYLITNGLGIWVSES